MHYAFQTPQNRQTNNKLLSIAFGLLQTTTKINQTNAEKKKQAAGSDPKKKARFNITDNDELGPGIKPSDILNMKIIK